jgi:hypothetical protein
MAFSSLNNMTVPGADGVSTGQGLLMPKLQYRFRVLFSNIGNEKDPLSLTRQVIDVTRPNVSFPEIPLEIYNSRVYLAGKPTWEPITFNVRDDVNGTVAGIIGKQVQMQMDFQEQSSAAAGIDYKFNMQIQILDGGNGTDNKGSGASILEEWQLYGCYLSAVNYNTLNYGTNEAVTISATVRYDNAIQYGLGGDNPVATAGHIAGSTGVN